MKPRPIEDRFWEKVDKDGPVPPHCPEIGPCWLWTAHKHPTSGYGTTAAENNSDMVEKGRSAFGVRHSQAKLSEESVRAIRAEYAAGGVSQRKLAAQYGVDQRLITLICKRRLWRHVA